MRALSADPRTLKRPESPDRFQATGLMLVALLALSSAACGQPQGGPPPGGPGGLPGGPPGGPGGPGGFSGGPGGPGGFMRMVPVMTALDADAVIESLAQAATLINPLTPAIRAANSPAHR